MHPAELTDALKRRAGELGFALVGATPAVRATGVSRLAEWLARGYAGQMDYIAERQAAYEHPRHVLDGVRSMVMLGMNYGTSPPYEPGDGQGRVSRYAWGEVDYHDLIHGRLKQLAATLRQCVPQARVRGVVDTAPLLEREFAQLAGLGWVGKHTLLINPQHGSWFFLAALLTDQELVYDVPFAVDHCGTCRACLDACPTGAFPQPYVLDARRCISYLTIELRDAMPAELRQQVGDWMLGCDVCQQVCPWNRQASEASEPAFFPESDLDPIDAAVLLEMSEEAFRRRFRKTALWRPRRKGLLRNAATVLGNQRSRRGLKALVHGLSDAEPVVRGACVWALQRYDQPEAAAALAQQWERETDPQVIREFDRHADG